MTQPRRDVDVTYKVPVAGGADMAILQRLRYSAALRRQRVDLPTSGNWITIDFAAHTMQVVRDESREVVEQPAPEQAAPSAADYARVGEARVDDLPCTEWRTRDTRGAETIACYTADGVLLRARTSDRVLMEAVNVAYAPQGAEVFTAPKAYSRQRAVTP